MRHAGAPLPPEAARQLGCKAKAISSIDHTRNQSNYTSFKLAASKRCDGPRVGQVFAVNGRRSRQICRSYGGRSTLGAIVLVVLVFCLHLPGGYGVDADDTASTTDGVVTTTEFNYAARGSKKMTDKCDSTFECGFPGSVCDPAKKSCQCVDELPVTNHIDKCGKVAAFNESCFFNEQCEEFNVQTECRDGRCICRFEMSPIIGKDGAFECKGKSEPRVPERYIDPAMIGILAGMALMFIIICVVLRLFSRARWVENRTIFNTPNPRLMNVSLLRESKLLHGQERRGSKISVRMPSRQPSMASLRPTSPNPSIGSRRGSSSNASGSSARSAHSGSFHPAKSSGLVTVTSHQDPEHQQQRHHVKAQITNVPVIEVEVIDPKA